MMSLNSFVAKDDLGFLILLCPLQGYRTVVDEMLGAELLSNLYDKLGRLLTSSEEPYSWQVPPNPDSLCPP